MSENAFRKLLLGLSVVCLAVLCASGTRLSAQVVKGSISGTIIDASGAVVPGADVSAVEASTGGTYSTVAAADGAFKLPLLAIGTYTLTVTKEGFRKLTLTAVGVNSSVDTYLGELKLEVGKTTTTMEVTAAAPWWRRRKPRFPTPSPLPPSRFSRAQSRGDIRAAGAPSNA